MARNLDSRCAKCRRSGVKLFLKGERCNSAKCAIIKRNYAPGVHGPKGRGKLTDFGQQLMEKQKAKWTYGILEKQFLTYYDEATRKTGEAGENLLQLLEMRLDNVVFRLGFAPSRAEARQVVNHGAFTVNGKHVDIPSFQVRVGEVIALSPSGQKSKLFANLKETLDKKQAPSWLSLDAKNLSGKVLDKPKGQELENVFDVRSIIEFYSR